MLRAHSLDVGHGVWCLSVCGGRAVHGLRRQHRRLHAGLLLLLLLRGLHHVRAHELTDVVELVVLPGIGNGLTESAAHGDVVCEVGGKATVEVGILRLQVCSQSSVLHGQVVIFLLVHLLVDHIGFGDTERSAGAALVNLRCATCRLDAGFKAAVAAARGGNIGSAGCQFEY